MLRRLEKRIIVDLPTFEARKKMLQTHLPPNVIKENGLILNSELDYNRLGELTDGYSGSDLKLVCKEAAMKSIRKVFAVLENLNEGNERSSVIINLFLRIKLMSFAFLSRHEKVMK